MSIRQDRVRRFLLCGLAGVASILSISCTPSAYVPRVKPAEINLRGIDSLSVYRIEGSEGVVLAGLIEAALLRSQRFKLLERDNVDKVLREQQMSFDAAFESGHLQGGKLLPASAFIVGSAAEPSYHEEIAQSFVKCGKKGLDTCIRSTRSGSLSYGATIKVASAETGSVVAVKALRASEKAQSVELGGVPEPFDRQAMLERCRARVVDQFMHMIAPFTVNEQVDLYEHSDFPELELANDYLRNGDTTRALALYAKVAAQANARLGLEPKVRARIHYVLAVALALSGDYARAHQALRQAIAIQPHREYVVMDRRFRQWESDDAQVATQSAQAADASAETVALDVSSTHR